MAKQYSALNTMGTSYVPETDKFAEEQRGARMREWLTAQSLGSPERAAQIAADASKYATDAGLKSNGTFVDRAANALAVQNTANTGAATVARIGADGQIGSAAATAAPNRDLAALAGRKYDDERRVTSRVDDIILSKLPSFGGGQPAAGQPTFGGAPGAAAPGMSVQDREVFGVLAALRGGGAMPDFEGQALERKVNNMKVEDMERARTMQRALEARASGDNSTAVQLAKAGGVTLPRADAAAAASMPEVKMKIERAGRMAESFANASFAGDSDKDRFKLALDEAVQAIADTGVDPDEARAIVAQTIDARIPARSGLLGQIMSDIGYGLVIPMVTGGAGRATRVNEIRDLTGY